MSTARVTGVTAETLSKGTDAPQARLTGIAVEVLAVGWPPSPPRVTLSRVALVGLDETGPARVTGEQVQLAGTQDPESYPSDEATKAKVTFQQVQLAGIADPEQWPDTTKADSARMTWLSIQIAWQHRHVPPPYGGPVIPHRQAPCSMYGVIRAGEEESGISAERGTYKRLSDAIFLYRRELLQRTRLAYYDAEDYIFTVQIPQGLP